MTTILQDNHQLMFSTAAVIVSTIERLTHAYVAYRVPVARVKSTST
jgi:hypothetical protein